MVTIRQVDGTVLIQLPVDVPVTITLNFHGSYAGAAGAAAASGTQQF
jgi:predicted membrane protein